MARDIDLLWDIATGELTFATATAARTVGNYLKRMETVVMSITILSDGVANTSITGATLTVKPVNVYDNVLASWTLTQVGSTNVLTGSQTLNSDAITTLLGTTIERANCVLDIATAAHLESETLAIVLQNNVTRSTDGTPTATAASITASGYTMNTGRILARWSAGSGIIQEATIGSGLSLSGSGVLSATGSGGTWGSITGTLSAQTDLQTALDAKEGTITILPVNKGGTGLTALGTGVPAALGNAVNAAAGFITFSGTFGSLSGVEIEASGIIVAAGFTGPLTGNVTGDASGNAGTVTSIGSLTGDVTSSNRETTLATVNSNVGSFTNASVTVNAKGLVTAASSGTAFDPASPGAIGGTTPAAGSFTTLGASGILSAATGNGYTSNGNNSAKFVLGNNPNFGVYFGADNPEISAAKGSLYLSNNFSSPGIYQNTDGGTSWGFITNQSGANPSASVGLTAVNGSAGTFMRSDGAPALDVSIAPTWSGAHIFSKAGAASTSAIQLTGTPFTGGTGATTFPLFYLATAGATAPTTLNTSGTMFGMNAPNGFGGNLIDWRINGTRYAYMDNSGSFFIGTAGNTYIATSGINCPGGGITLSGTAINAMNIIQGNGNNPMSFGTVVAQPVTFGTNSVTRITIAAGGGVTLGAGGTSLTNIRHLTSGAMVGGTATVTDTAATANTKYFPACKTLGTVTVVSTCYVSSISAGASFVLTAGVPTDTSTWYILAIEP